MPLPASPSSCADAPSKLIAAWLRVGSSVLIVVRDTPLWSRSTITRLAPLPSLTSTTAWVAISPSVTGIFRPEMVPSFSRVAIVPGVISPGPSLTAMQPITLPSATFGSSACFCSSLPASFSASAKK